MTSAALNCREFVGNLKNLILQNPSVTSPFLPTCRQDGSYFPRQCDSSSGLCRCVDPQSGSEILGTVTSSSNESALICPGEKIQFIAYYNLILFESGKAFY